jgi:septum formation protein
MRPTRNSNTGTFTRGGITTNLVDFVLASRSPRRRELVSLAGLRFRIVAVDTHEQRHPDEPPADYARRLSREKARAARQALDRPALILAADTIVVDGEDVLEKPGDADEAAAMLRRLRGRTHHVITGVTLLDAATGQTMTQAARSPVPMREYTDEEIAAYIESGDPFDKAGAYGIQHNGFHPAEGFAHCFANVMGLPLCHLTRMLRALGVEPPADVPAACQRALDYDCPVFALILAGGE